MPQLPFWTVCHHTWVNKGSDVLSCDPLPGKWPMEVERDGKVLVPILAAQTIENHVAQTVAYAEKVSEPFQSHPRTSTLPVGPTLI